MWRSISVRNMGEPEECPRGLAKQGFVYVSFAWKRRCPADGVGLRQSFAKTDGLLKPSRQPPGTPRGVRSGQQWAYFHEVVAATQACSRPPERGLSRPKCTYSVRIPNQARFA